MDNTIPVRIYDFLKGHPPFNLFDRATLLSLASQAIVQYRPKSEVIFQQGTMPGGLIFVLKEGAVHLFHEENDERELVDQCDEGELFGLRPLLAEDAYALTAVAAEETLLYAIPVAPFREAAEQSPGVLMYIASNFASGWQRRTTPESKGKIFAGQSGHSQDAFQLIEVQSIDRGKAPRSMPPRTKYPRGCRHHDRKGSGFHHCDQ
jgi:CBS domain-containing protein